MGWLARLLPALSEEYEYDTYVRACVLHCYSGSRPRPVLGHAVQ
jgi:hypothetical protein